MTANNIFKQQLNKKFAAILIFIIICIIGAIFYFYRTQKHNILNDSQNNLKVVPSVPNEANNLATSSLFTPPIANWQPRASKKPFGIFVTPQNSPVSPEKFTGFHTGVDFETFADEQEIDVPIFSVCDGPLIYKNYVSGYGGVAIQVCQIEGQDVTILYGHLKLASISFILGDQLGPGEEIGILGKGYSAETDGERKHLHLAIHKGNEISFRGYVQNQSELKNWIDILSYLK